MEKKVLFVTTISGTIEAFFIPHIQYFLERGFTVGIATNTTDNKLEALERLGVEIYPIPFTRHLLSRGNLTSFWHLRKIIKRYDVLHLHTPIASFIVRMVSSNKQVVLYTSHGFHFNEHGSRISNLMYFIAEKIAGYKTTRLIVTNKDDIKAAEKIVPATKIRHVNGVGVDPSRYNRDHYSTTMQLQWKLEHGIALNKTVITHLAEFNDNKRQLDVVHACEDLIRRTENFIILLIGTGENYSMIKQYIKDHQLENYIHCVGFQENIPRWLSITDIGLLVSLREGLPRSIMEMMLMEIPVIATNIRGNRDLVIDGKNGFLIPIKDPMAIAECCEKFVLDQNLAIAYGNQGRYRILRLFSLSIVLDQMENLYKELDIVE